MRAHHTRVLSPVGGRLLFQLFRGVLGAHRHHRRIRALTIVDVCTRELPWIEVATSIPGDRVVRVLDRLAETRARGVGGRGFAFRRPRAREPDPTLASVAPLVSALSAWFV